MDLFADSLREALRLLLQGNRYVLDVVLLSLRGERRRRSPAANRIRRRFCVLPP